MPKIVIDILFAITIMFLVCMIAMIFIAPNGGYPRKNEEITQYHFRIPLFPVHNKHTGDWGVAYLEGELIWAYAPMVRMWKWWRAGFPTRWGKH